MKKANRGNFGTCAKCHVTPNGETVSAEIVQPGTQDATGVGYISHFATCPVANMFRKK